MSLKVELPLLFQNTQFSCLEVREYVFDFGLFQFSLQSAAQQLT